MKRENTRKIMVGNVQIGGQNKVVIQSMCNTKTKDINATIKQILNLEKAGCEIIRVACLDIEDAKAIKQIKEQIHIPIVADIHFDYRIALESIEAGVDKVRINPGNIGSEERVKMVVDKCKEKNIPIRIKNTNRPNDPGTLIVDELSKDSKALNVTGIAGRKDFTVISIYKALMNSELGFCRKVLSILENKGVSFENMPAGIDTVCLVIDSSKLNNKLNEIVDEIKMQCNPDSIEVNPNMSVIATVGRGMAKTPGIAAKIFNAVYEANINIKMIDQGSSEMNILIGIDNSDFEKATNAIYNAFVK